ncbi:MAG: hypothetical protein J0H20_03465, partial [Rhizobiales bacterium]|nr:hypothetical protein [Hyphomicrobiales bacterium]
PTAGERLARALTNDTSLGVMRYADAGYEDALDEATAKHIRRFDVPSEAVERRG